MPDVPDAAGNEAAEPETFTPDGVPESEEAVVSVGGAADDEITVPDVSVPALLSLCQWSCLWARGCRLMAAS